MLWRPLRSISVITKEKRKLHSRLANVPLLFNENQLYIIQDFAENVCKCKQTVQVRTVFTICNDCRNCQNEQHSTFF